jgi:hypothetical protein
MTLNHMAVYAFEIKGLILIKECCSDHAFRPLSTTDTGGLRTEIPQDTNM